MVLGAVGAVLMLAGLGGALIARKHEDKKPKDALETCFERARLYIKQKGPDGKDVYVYPAVTQRVKLGDHDAYHFRLPIGVNPTKLHNYSYVFKQGFGEYIDMEGENSEFILRAFKGPIAAFDYNYDEVPIAGRIPVVIGKSRRNYVVYDMTENPHLLIAGLTGSGKSTALRAVLVSIIKHCGADVELYCADLKRSEFHLFKPYAKEVVVTGDDLKHILDQLSEEMKRRGDLCDEHEVASVYDLPVKLPSIILAIDELAMLKKDKEIMSKISDVAAIGRALGVFLILSMQRPDGDVIDGKIKANLSVRLAFRHADGINSRITLDSMGAENIRQSDKGRGLLKMDGIVEVQSPYLSLDKAREILGK